MLAVAATTCSGSSSNEVKTSTTTTEAPSTSSTAPAAPTSDDLVDVDVAPGESADGFVGARGDVTLDRCEKVDDGWIASGDVTNASGSDASYRIYLALNITDSSITRALVQVDATVADGDTQPWEVTVPRSEIWGLDCILRVERVAA